MNRKLLRLLGTAQLVDGLLSLVLGARCARLWMAGKFMDPCRRLARWVSQRPEWQIGLAGAAEVGLGLAVLARAPVRVQELYHAWAGVYDPISYAWRNWVYPDIHRAFDRAITAHLPPGGRVLDLGCGTGANLERLLTLGLPFGSYVGVDLNGDMLAQARAKFAHVPNVDFRQLDLLTDPLPKGPFDLALSTWVFSHLPNPRQVVEKAVERLRPGAHAILLFLAETGFWPDRLVDPILGFFASRPLPEDVYCHFLGLVSAQRFGGGTMVMVILRKPDDAT